MAILENYLVVAFKRETGYYIKSLSFFNFAEVCKFLTRGSNYLVKQNI